MDNIAAGDLVALLGAHPAVVAPTPRTFRSAEKESFGTIVEETVIMIDSRESY